MHSRNEYLKVLREKNFESRAKKEKSQILDEYCSNTGQSRKIYYQEDTQGGSETKQRKKRKESYDGQVKTALAKVWEIVDCPCGQRLKPILEAEVDRLRKFGELQAPDKTFLKLKKISSATIDRKLKHQREVLHLLKSKGGPKPGSFLKQKIPIRLIQWDTSKWVM